MKTKPKVKLSIPTPYGVVEKQVAESIAGKYKYVAIVVDNATNQIIDSAWTFKTEKMATDQLRAYKEPDFQVIAYALPTYVSPADCKSAIDETFSGIDLAG